MPNAEPSNISDQLPSAASRIVTGEESGSHEVPNATRDIGTPSGVASGDVLMCGMSCCAGSARTTDTQARARLRTRSNQNRGESVALRLPPVYPSRGGAVPASFWEETQWREAEAERDQTRKTARATRRIARSSTDCTKGFPTAE